MINCSSLTSNSIAPTTLNVSGTLNVNSSGSGTTIIGNATSTTIQSPNLTLKTGSNSTLLQTSATSNYSLVLPVSQGSSTQTLSNDGSGNLSWANHGCTCQSLLVLANYVYSSSNAADIYTNLSGSQLNMKQVLVGAQYLSPGSADGITTPYTSFIVPTTGTYSFRFTNWICGQGNGQSRMRVLRSATLVWDSSRQKENQQDCSMTENEFLWNGFQAGDVCTFYCNENPNAGYPTPITNPGYDEEGKLIIFHEL